MGALPHPPLHVCERSILSLSIRLHLKLMHSNPRYHFYAIIRLVVIGDWPCVATYQMYFVWSARRCLDPHWLRAAQSQFQISEQRRHLSRAPGKQFGVLDRWRDRHMRPARWSNTLRLRPVRWRKWNRIRIDLARLADPIGVTEIWLMV